jgi:hypothetical protein
VAAAIPSRITVGKNGAADSEIFEHLTEPDRLAMLSAWQTQTEAADFAKSILPIVEAAKLDLYVIRVLRDYGQRDRREAPQYHD